MAPMLGYQPDEIPEIDDWWTEQLHPDDRAQVLEEWRNLPATATRRSAEYRVRHKDGHYLDMWDRATLIRDEAGQIIRMVGNTINITARKQAEETLAAALAAEQQARQQAAESLALLDTMLEAAPVGFAFVDRDLRFQRINTALAAMNGQTVENHLGRAARELYPYAAPRWELLWKEVLTSGRPLLDMELSGPLRGSGTGHALVSYYPVRPSGGETLGIGVLVTDITRRKRSEAAKTLLASASKVLAASLNLSGVLNSLARLLAEELADFCAITLFDVEGAVEQELLFHRDPQHQALLDNLQDLSSDAAVVGQFLQAVLGDSQSLLLSDIPPTFAATLPMDERGQQIAALVNGRSSMVTRLLARGRMVGLLALARGADSPRYDEDDLALLQDLAGRLALAVDNARLFGAAQRAAERIRRLQHTTAALVEAITPEQVTQVLTTHGVAALAAHAASIALLDDEGTTLHRVRLPGYLEEIDPAWDTLPLALPNPLTDAVRTGEAVWLENREALLQHYPTLVDLPSSLPMQACAALPVRINERLIGAISICYAEPRQFGVEESDMLFTLARLCGQALEVARLYTTAQAARERAEAAVRLRDQFLSIASHELKTPLTSLLGNAQLVQRRLGQEGVLTERLERNLHMMIDQGRRLDRLIATLLDVSRIELGHLALERNSFDMVVLVQRIAEEQRPHLLRHRLELTLPAAPLPMVGDAMRLEQVLQNLVQNAVKYSPDGGTVRVSLRLDGQATCCITVSDEGIGIPADALPRLFQRFFRADNTATHAIVGMGIGLYVVKEIVELHGGSISVASVENEGSTFTVVLPLERTNDE
ncbi:MAG: ATP-binding protein [Chloroflexaceae bacterium]|nr:ATP-binding protein [Chloroflexaceae bacterium]